LTSCKPVSFSRRTLHYGVSKSICHSNENVNMRGRSTPETSGRPILNIAETTGSLCDFGLLPRHRLELRSSRL